MSIPAVVAEKLRRILLHPTRGVAGVVEDLLAVCQEYALQLDWQADCLRVRSFGGEWEELRDVRLRKSVFRAILARVAALCNERVPDAVSPYEGQGEFAVLATPAAAFRIAFINTPETQKLELTAAATPAAKAAQPPDTAESRRKHAEKYPSTATAPHQPGAAAPPGDPA
jgi:hypothetical protein